VTKHIKQTATATAVDQACVRPQWPSLCSHKLHAG